MNRKSFLQWLTGFVAVGSHAKAIATPSTPSIRSPGKIDPTLLRWMSLPRIPVLESEDEKVTWLVSAMLKRQSVEFIYLGGSEPGKRRMVSPGLLFRTESLGSTYVQGFCHRRGEERVFRVDKILSTDMAN